MRLVKILIKDDGISCIQLLQTFRKGKKKNDLIIQLYLITISVASICFGLTFSYTISIRCEEIYLSWKI